jgi:hypothetical protein
VNRCGEWAAHLVDGVGKDVHDKDARRPCAPPSCRSSPPSSFPCRRSGAGSIPRRSLALARDLTTEIASPLWSRRQRLCWHGAASPSSDLDDGAEKRLRQADRERFPHRGSRSSSSGAVAPTPSLASRRIWILWE